MIWMEYGFKESCLLNIKRTIVAGIVMGVAPGTKIARHAWCGPGFVSYT